MKRGWLVLCVIIGCLAVSGPAFARKATNQDAVFAEVDENGDGKVSQEEFFIYIEKTSFGILDADGNRKITLTEWLVYEKGATAEAVFLTMDEDRDGVLTYEEIIAVPMKRKTINNLFGTMDDNGDGMLELEELKNKPE